MPGRASCDTEGIRILFLVYGGGKHLESFRDRETRWKASRALVRLARSGSTVYQLHVLKFHDVDCQL